MLNDDKISIVLVDDQQVFLDGLSSIINSQVNFELLFVDVSPKNALKKIKNQLPDIIITDMSMKEMSGIEFIQSVKRQYPQMKILVLSMYQNIQKFDGIDGYLVKETNKEILIEVINGIVLENKKYNIVKTNNNEKFIFNVNILSNREKEIINFISNQNTTEQIAQKLTISKATIESHKKNIFFKLKVNCIAGLMKRSFYLGIID